MEQDGIEAVFVDSDGKEWPGWALRAGFTITATEYDHGKRRIKIWLSDEEALQPDIVETRVGS
jgi:hypothetical protein